MTFADIRYTTYAGTDPQPGFVSLYVDAAADLPTVAAIQTAGNVDPLPGSTCITCDTGQIYLLDSAGSWHAKQGETFSNVYTQSEVDALLAPITSAITGLQSDVLAISPGFFQLGSVIPDGTDLNDLQTPGIYISTSGAHTATMINCPVSSSAFRLEIKYTALTTRFIQTLQAGATNIYTRNKYSDSAWNHWYRYSGTDTGA